MSAFTDTTHGVRGSTDHSNLKAQGLRQHGREQCQGVQGQHARTLPQAFDFGF